MAYEKLFEKGRIGPLTIRNRAVMSPMGTDFADTNGNASPRLIAYYAERAKGGIGLIINEYTGVDDVDSIPTQHNLRMAQDYNVKAAEELTRTVHRYGAKIFAQLHHGGATSKSAFTGRQNLSPSGIPMTPAGEVPREMTLEDIRRVQDKFVAAAVRCKKAGYDGVELHAAHGYLMTQFLSAYYNHRTDQYGGSLENRCRFIDEVIAGIREKLGNYPISVRICGDEMTDHPGFWNLEGGLAIARHLEAQGIDCINISNGSSWNGNANCEPFSYTPGWKKHVAKAFKEALSIPVIATNTVKDPDFAEQLLEEGVSDFVALGRSQFADPEFMNKAKAGRPETIRKCISCMYCRERLLGGAMPVECSLNPRLGAEYRYRWQDLQKNGAGRPVVVVGGGPGGLECAIILAKRGFAVTLLEKGDTLGGTLNIAKLPPFKANIQGTIDVLALEARENGVDIRLNTEATPDLVKSMNPVGVFLAVGAPPLVPKSIPGIEKAVLAEDVILGKALCGPTAILVGTGLTGLECAEMVLEHGHKLTMVEMNPAVGQGIYNVVFNDIMSRITPHAPEVLTSHKLTAVTESGAEVTDLTTGETKSLSADTVILALGTHDQEAMLEAYEQLGLNTVLVGSAEVPGRIAGAIRGGFEKAWVFEAE
ncbi:oxidoreductase [Dysosmobacter sp.]|uniref:oxidoreductase n=1 Tax=Dysosmobacter sp. TaxID=2591382 RepID=UPI002A9AAA4A|nr:FAD-dependent oxidoreductase [Dysosmobacter sp.]MDY5612915.1 FAD-dependent oxidoreductase [Dysosmobacter sp.]